MPDQRENLRSCSPHCATYYEIKFDIEMWLKSCLLLSEMAFKICEKIIKSILNDLKTHRMFTNLRKFSSLGHGEKNAGPERLLSFLFVRKAKLPKFM